MGKLIVSDGLGERPWDKDVQDLADQLVMGGLEVERGIGYVGELADLVMTARAENATLRTSLTRAEQQVQDLKRALRDIEQTAASEPDEHMTPVRHSIWTQARAALGAIREASEGDERGLPAAERQGTVGATDGPTSRTEDAE